MSGIAAYHGLDAATHQQRVNDLAAAGLRPVALDVSGDPVDPRYAAVWLERPGPPGRPSRISPPTSTRRDSRS
jgi:Bacterial tandem repeat domain 1